MLADPIARIWWRASSRRLGYSPPMSLDSPLGPRPPMEQLTPEHAVSRSSVPSPIAAGRVQLARSLLAALLVAVGVAAVATRTAASTVQPPTRAARALPQAGAAAQTANKKASCSAGHIVLTITGQSMISSQQPMSYTFVARLCGGRGATTLPSVRLYVRGPQKFAWVISRLRPATAVHRVFQLTFTEPAHTVTFEARARGGKLLARRVLTAKYVQPELLAAVGDIACPYGDTQDACKQRATANLVASERPNAVAVLGDNQYQSGQLSEYDGPGAYNETWGQFNSIVYPTPGNHEYLASSSASGYFTYFGARAPGNYYSYELGAWHVISLDSACSDAGCTAATVGSTTTAQVDWLKRDLRAHRNQCILAYWHHPRFTSGAVQDSTGVAPLWEALYAARADVVLNGHDHMYERYAQQDPNQKPTSEGIREFVVGTGGMSLFPVGTIQPNLQFLDNKHFGVLFLTLYAGSYQWAFRAINGTLLDSGSTACHSATGAQ